MLYIHNLTHLIFDLNSYYHFYTVLIQFLCGVNYHVNDYIWIVWFVAPFRIE